MRKCTQGGERKCGCVLRKNRGIARRNSVQSLVLRGHGRGEEGGGGSASVFGREVWSSLREA